VRGRGGGGGNPGGEFPGDGFPENKFTPENDYFRSDDYIFSRIAYELSKLSNLSEGFLEAVQRWNLNKSEEKKLEFRLRRFLDYREKYRTSPDMDAVFSDTPAFSASVTQSILKDFFRPVL